MKSITSTVFVLLFTASSVLAQTPEAVAIQYVDSLLDNAYELRGKNKLNEAMSLCGVADSIIAESIGNETVSAAKAIHLRGTVFQKKGDFKEAEKYMLRATAIREKLLPKTDEIHLSAMNDLGSLYRRLGEYEKARALFLEAKETLEKSPNGREKDVYGGVLTNYALLLTETQEYEQCENLYKAALENREKVHGKETAKYAIVLTNLGLLYARLQLPELAIGYYEEAARIFKEQLGDKHPYYLQVRSNLSSVVWKLGDEKSAEGMLLECAAAAEESVGKEHPKYGFIKYNLGVQKYKKANFEQAQPLLQEAYSIFKNSLGTKHPMYAQCLNSLSLVHLELGNYTVSEMLQEESKALIEEKLGTENTDYCGAVVNLGKLHSKNADFVKAEQAYLQAMTIFENQLKNVEHPFYLKCTNLLATLYLDKGMIDKAKPIILKTQAARNKAFHRRVSDYLYGLTTVARLHELEGNFPAADATYEKIHAQHIENLSEAVTFQSESELAGFVRLFHQDVETLNQVLLSRAQTESELSSIAYDNALFQKGFLLNTAYKLNQAAVETEESEELYIRLKGYRRQLAQAYANTSADATEIEVLEKKANKIEKQLARLVSGYARNTEKANWRQVQKALKPGEAAIEFVHFAKKEATEADQNHYAALLITANGNQPKFIPLFEENSLKKLLETQKARRSDYVNTVYTSSLFYTQLWQPLESYLDNTSIIYFSPSGLLHRLKLEAILTPDGQILADAYNFIQLGSTRQLVEYQVFKNVETPYAALFGGVQFGVGNIASIDSEPSSSDLPMSNNRGVLDFSAIDSTLRGGEEWGDLPWTQKEVDTLQTILLKNGVASVLYKEGKATESSFKMLGNRNASKNTTAFPPRILHLATHGYFFPDPVTDNNGSSFQNSNHPMIRSGLILAGGNYAWKNGTPVKPNMEDGVLTAYEISQMDLSNTELVVLSACETGLGDIQGNEGVYGLQRAFKIAGAQNVIMSLWQVPDFQTQELMTSFYGKWLNDKIALPDAFRAAQKEMRAKYEHPYFWAGFVLVE